MTIASIVQRVAAGLAAATPEALHLRAERQRAACAFAAAAALLQQATTLGHGRWHADLAWLLVEGRQGLPKDSVRAFAVAEAGALKGCCHSRGVLALCYLRGCGCTRDSARALVLAQASASAGSAYGQYAIAYYHHCGFGDVQRDFAQAFAWCSTAAGQGLDAALSLLGLMHARGEGVAQNRREALRWLKLAAEQGYPEA